MLICIVLIYWGSRANPGHAVGYSGAVDGLFTLNGLTIVFRAAMARVKWVGPVVVSPVVFILPGVG